ncbi:ATP-dependent helicase HrpB [Pseudahrensia aquimaris]|uniref:ATP-dependent helicase HrpB n=1 Tax=Pseudahrensia aquimaris TaxID=744461 RepID=A0ABW3FE54_9HYPH
MISLPPSVSDLPIHEKLGDLLRLLETQSRAVLIAPPGAGKTTIVPLALLDAPWREGRKIIVLEPRRLAARGAASRMASLLGENVGETVGYRVRFDTKISAKTEIEVVTEGVFTRMLASDPGLEDVACILFDEFHERSLDSDLALALCLDLQTGLREDLRLIPMSATLDGGQVAHTIDAQVIESAGRQYPVEIVYREGRVKEAVEAQMASAVRAEIVQANTGSILCFLPGQREIERAFEVLKDTLPNDTDLLRLYGALSSAEQDAAIQPSPSGRRKVVLASAIAETSLTIDGITTVIDSGLSRLPFHELATGLTRLQTVRSDQASIAQRAGRAGRLGPGRAIRLWREQQTASLPKTAPPEIINADLTDLVLTLADWGVANPAQLIWLDPPPAPAWNEATALLRKLGALSAEGSLTEHGRMLARLPMPPRLAHMIASSANPQEATLLALVLQERGLGGAAVDVESRLARVKSGRDKRSQQMQTLAKRLAAQVGKAQAESESVGVTLALAFSERVAQRGGQSPNGMIRYTLANGRGAEIDAIEPLAAQDYLVVADMIGRAGAARIVSAAAIEKADLLSRFEAEIATVRSTRFDGSKGKLLGAEVRKFGVLPLEKPRGFSPSAEDITDALIHAVREQGLDALPWQKADWALLERLRFWTAHHTGADTPKRFCEAALIDELDEWLEPFIAGRTSLKELADGTLSNALLLRSGLGSVRDLDRILPSHFTAPTGSKIPIIFSAAKAVIAVRPQELFGLTAHPTIIDGTFALEIELLSPAGRPIQITSDLPGFWRGSWADVRADLRGRYPKHPWPENPLEAEPTQRAKPRK